MADDVSVAELQNGVDVSTGQARNMQLGGATVEIVGRNRQPTVATRMGHWDNAFREDGDLFVDANEQDHFIGADSRRFYIQVTDPSASTSCEVSWTTFDGAGREIDAAQSKRLRLDEVASMKGTFRSEALMMVSDEDDRLAAPLRLRRADVEGKTVVTYPANGAARATKELPIFVRNDRRRVTLQLIVASEAQNIGPGAAVWRHLRYMRETYARIGVTVKTVRASQVAAANVAELGGDVVVSEVIGDATGVDIPRKRQILSAIDRQPGAIIGLYIDKLSTGKDSESNMSDIPGIVGSLYIVNATRPYTLAHEVGHILTNRLVVRGNQAPAHFQQPDTAGTRLIGERNLMCGDKVSEHDDAGIKGTKRLWDANDASGFNQVAAILASTYVTPLP